MEETDVRAVDPAAHQSTKADMEEDVSIDATPGALAWSVTRDGAERCGTAPPPATDHD